MPVFRKLPLVVLSCAVATAVAAGTPKMAQEEQANQRGNPSAISSSADGKHCLRKSKLRHNYQLRRHARGHAHGPKRGYDLFNRTALC